MSMQQNTGKPQHQASKPGTPSNNPGQRPQQPPMNKPGQQPKPGMPNKK